MLAVVFFLAVVDVLGVSLDVDTAVLSLALLLFLSVCPVAL